MKPEDINKVQSELDEIIVEEQTPKVTNTNEMIMQMFGMLIDIIKEQNRTINNFIKSPPKTIADNEKGFDLASILEGLKSLGILNKEG